MGEKKAGGWGMYGGSFFQVMHGGLSMKFLVGGMVGDKMFFAARNQILLFALLFALSPSPKKLIN